MHHICCAGTTQSYGGGSRKSMCGAVSVAAADTSRFRNSTIFDREQVSVNPVFIFISMEDAKHPTVLTGSYIDRYLRTCC